MSFNAPTSVPQLDYASYAQSTHFPPSFTSVPYRHPRASPTDYTISINRNSNDRFVSVKGGLLCMLKKRQICHSPSGFPFRLSSEGTYSDNGVIQPHLLDSSFEFFEYVAGDPTCCASFSYTAPAYCDRGTLCRNMSWRIAIPSQDSGQGRTHPAFTVAQVELNPETLETTFGVEFMQDSHIIYELLSISLEQGLHLTVTLGYRTLSGKYLDDGRNRLSLKYEPEDVVIVAMGSDGRREVVQVYGRCGVYDRTVLESSSPARQSPRADLGYLSTNTL